MRLKRFLNIHVILLLVVLLTIVVVVVRFLNWGVRVDVNDYESEYNNEYKDTLDMILPVVDEDGNMLEDTDDETVIVCFGNAPFADDRNSKNNLANMIAAKTGATVYNCSIGKSYLASAGGSPYAEINPLDVFNFYWLLCVGAKAPMWGHWDTVETVLGDDMPPEGREVYNTLVDLDFNTVDVVAIMYDASDYLNGSPMYSDSADNDITQFTGNLCAGIELLRSLNPRLRIIVMSPTYAFAVDENGNYISSDQYTYGWDVLSTYSIKEAQTCMSLGVTFIDHIYGTITEDNAKDYLIDNLHLNTAGRELVADRFVEALQYYDQKD